MKETIYYVSDFKYFSRLTSGKYNSKKQMVGAHIRYIKDKADEIIGDDKKILENVDLVNKRINSRVAMSFVVAIPNILKKEEIKDWLKEIRKLIGEILNVNEEDIFIAYHSGKNSISGKENKHFHVVLTPRTKEGKPLRLKKTDLKEFHRRLQEYIKQKGFKIRKDREDERIGHMGTRLRYDESLRKAYIEILESKRRLREIENYLMNYKKENKKEKERKKILEEVYQILKTIEREEKEERVGTDKKDDIKKEEIKAELEKLLKEIEEEEKIKSKKDKKKGFRRKL